MISPSGPPKRIIEPLAMPLSARNFCPLNQIFSFDWSAGRPAGLNCTSYSTMPEVGGLWIFVPFGSWNRLSETETLNWADFSIRTVSKLGRLLALLTGIGRSRLTQIRVENSDLGIPGREKVE